MTAAKKCIYTSTYSLEASDSLFVASFVFLGESLSKCHYQSSNGKSNTLEDGAFHCEYRLMQQISVNLLHTKSYSSIRAMTRSAQSVTGITSGCLRKRRSMVNAAFFWTKLREVLEGIVVLDPGTHSCLLLAITYGEIRSLCTSKARVSAISLPPMLAIA